MSFQGAVGYEIVEQSLRPCAGGDSDRRAFYMMGRGIAPQTPPRLVNELAQAYQAPAAACMGPVCKPTHCHVTLPMRRLRSVKLCSRDEITLQKIAPSKSTLGAIGGMVGYTVVMSNTGRRVLQRRPVKSHGTCISILGASKTMGAMHSYGAQ